MIIIIQILLNGKNNEHINFFNLRWKKRYQGEAWEDRFIKLNPMKENFFSKNFFSGQKIDQFYYSCYRRGLSGKKKPIEKHIFLEWMYF